MNNLPQLRKMNEKKLQEKLVTKTTLIASLIMVVLSVAIIYLLLFIEKKTGDWPIEVWGVVYFILFSMFGLYYVILHPIFFKENQKQKEDAAPQIEQV